MRIVSWNVNGIRSNIVDGNTSLQKKPRNIESDSSLARILNDKNPDIICFQETRLGPDNYHLFEGESIKHHFPYQYWSSSKGEKSRSGNRYSGTAIWSKIKPTSVLYDTPGLHDMEGRFIQLNFSNLIVITTYTPNSGSNWDYRLEHWEPQIKSYLATLTSSDIPVVYCGDNNVANRNDVWFGDRLDRMLETEKDPLQKKKIMTKIKGKRKLHSGETILNGYSKQERDAFEKLKSECQLVDCFRYKYPEIIDQFTWFNIRMAKSFESNLGWLIDRFMIQKKHTSMIIDSRILHEVGIRNSKGVFISDHLPILLELSL